MDIGNFKDCQDIMLEVLLRYLNSRFTKEATSMVEIFVKESDVDADIEAQVHVILNKIKNEIVNNLKLFNKTELMIAFLYVKGHIQYEITFRDNKIVDSEYIELLIEMSNDICAIIGVILEIKENEFLNKQFKGNEDRIDILIQLMKEYNIIENSLEFYNTFYKGKVKSIDEFMIPNRFYFKPYYDFTEKQMITSEDMHKYSIKNLDLQKQVENYGLYKYAILKQLDIATQENLGFTSETRRILINFINDAKFSRGLLMKKEELLNEIKLVFPSANEHELLNVLRMFTINNCNEFKNDLELLRLIEVKCVYEVEDYVYINPLDYVHSDGLYIEFVTKMHNLNYFTTHLNKVQKSKLTSFIDKSEIKNSTYLSYLVLDYFIEKNFKPPLKDGIPYPEIKSFISKNEKGLQINILMPSKGNDKGDIDVLVLDEKNKEILNIEIKYLQPFDSVYKFNSVKLMESRQKMIDKVKVRENIIEENIETVVEFLNGQHPYNNYKVKSIYVTPYLDYYFYIKRDQINYYSISELFEKYSS